MRILLRTEYKGEAAAKLVSDLDKISSVSKKTSAVIHGVGPELKKLYENANARNKALLLGQFPELAGVSQTAQLPNERMIKAGIARVLAMGKFPGQMPGAIMQSNQFLAQGAASLLSMGAFNPGGGLQLPNEKMLAAGVKRALAMGPLFPPPPPGFGSQFLNAFGGKFGGGRAALAGGMAGAAAFVAFEALKTAINALTKVMQSFVNAFSSARELYAKALISGGLGLGFTSRREALASIIGVSSKDVYQFGQAVLFLNPKIEWATNLIAKMTPNLTATAWEFNVLKLNTEALFMSLANDAAPALRAFAEGLSVLVKALERSKGTLEFMFKTAVMAAANLVGGAGAGEAVKRAFEFLANIGGGRGAAPQPIAFMQQMRASAAEHMGFVVGFSGGFNPAVQTANNTKKMVQQLGIIIRHSTKGGSFYDPFQTSQSYP